MQPEIMAKQTEAGAKQVGTEAKQVDTEAKQERAKSSEAGAKTSGAPVAWENPLIPNARLRQIYLSMAQARAVEKAQPAAQRAHTVGPNATVTGTHGLEAALVSASFDLGPGDLISDALTGGAIDLLRGTSLSEILHPNPSTVSRRRQRNTTASTTAARLSAPSAIAERIWSALGAAAASKSATAQARAEAKTQTEDDEQADTPARQAGVVALFMLPGEAPPALLKTALAFAAKEFLPIVFVVLPAPSERFSKAQLRNRKPRATKLGGVSALSLACGVPGIAVDADDAIAIYRVAQESIGRARAGGGAALIECLPFILEGASTAAKRTAPADAIATLERYLLQRGVATRSWIEREAKSFAKRIAKSKPTKNSKPAK